MTRRFATIFVLLLAVLWIPAGASADTTGSIDASADVQGLTVGDPFWYTVKLIISADSQPQLPGNEVDFGGFEIRDYDAETTQLPDGRQQITLRYQLVGFTVGERQIADFEVEAKRTVDGKEHIDKYLAPPVTVTIESVLPPQGGELKPKPIYGPMFLAPWWYSWVWPTVIALAILAALLVGVWLWQRQARRTPGEPERELTPQEEAHYALAALRNRKLIAAGKFKAFYSELGDILRRWLQHRADIPAMEATTPIIRYDLRRSELADDWQEDFIALLSRGDLVKFAKWIPQDDIAYSDLEEAFELLQRGAITEPVDELEIEAGDREGAAA